MNDAEQIKTVVTQYTGAAKRADMKVLARVCTPVMLRQFSFSVRAAIRLAALLMPKRMRELAPAHLEIESQGANKAVVSFATAFGRRRHYERIVLLKEDGCWRVDGKYA